MPLHVIDVGSNEEENLKRWANALKGGGDKLDVFGIVYSGKRRRWTAREICQALGGRISQKRVTEVGKKLAGDTLLTQIDQYPVVYEKRDEVHHRKGRILSLARNSKKRECASHEAKFEGGSDCAGSRSRTSIR